MHASVHLATVRMGNIFQLKIHLPVDVWGMLRENPLDGSCQQNEIW